MTRKEYCPNCKRAIVGLYQNLKLKGENKRNPEISHIKAEVSPSPVLEKAFHNPTKITEIIVFIKISHLIPEIEYKTRTTPDMKVFHLSSIM